MTKLEFHEWFRWHCSRFTGVRGWLDKVTRGTEAPSETEILKAWYGVLQYVELSAAKDASDKMHSGDIEEPKGFDRHPSAIRRACGAEVKPTNDSGPRYDDDGNQTYACLLCMDVGAVVVWHPDTVAKIAKSGFSNPMYQCALPCTCKAGNAFARSFPKSPRYDPKRACLIGVGGVDDDGEQQKLKDWLSSRKPIMPDNYEPDFETPQPLDF